MDPCWLCQCRGGISFCSKAECAELDCENFYIPEGECCPVCIGTRRSTPLTSSRFLMILMSSGDSGSALRSHRLSKSCGSENEISSR